MEKINLKELHKKSSKHRKSLDESEICGCFYCCKIFDPKLIEEWIDKNTTAICPYCGIDSILAEKDVHITKELLKDMYFRWFSVD